VFNLRDWNWLFKTNFKEQHKKSVAYSQNTYCIYWRNMVRISIFYSK
jgi:hypothetical protein